MCNCSAKHHDTCWDNEPNPYCSCCADTLENMERTNMAKLFVRCCETNKPNKATGDSGDNIYLDWENLPPTRGRVPVFRYMGNDEVFSYCPWCGVLLDLNLEMSP